jgi:hypothetical protein
MRVFTTAVRSAVLLLVSLAMSPAFAQDPGDQGSDQDPPGRVARLSLTQGSVSLQPAGVEDWAAADVNRPLTTGDKLWTDQDSRAELDIGSAAIRLGSTTGFSFLNLDDHSAQMQVTAGTVIVRVRALNKDDNFEVDTPNLAVSLQQPGQYRVEVSEAGDSTVVEVAEGDAQAAGDGAGYPIHAQQKATFTGTQQLSSVIGTLGAPDELDDWSLSRDRQVQSAQSQQYVSTEATGYADLDNNGQWENTPDYGYVWTPTTVAVGWSPYRFGHWVWIAPWGWTWIDDAPWGFAPFHYGRWVTFRDRWCWVPGPRRVRPVYAPALVAWVGGPAAGVSVTVGAGVGWFPLGPREVYVPSYRVSPRYVERVNVTNTVIVNRTYINNVYQNRVTNINYLNRNARGGTTTVTQTVFTSAQPVGRNWIRDERGSRTLPVRTTAPAIVPVRQSLVGANARVSVRQPPATIMGRQVVVRTQPPHAPVPFERQTEAIRANGGRPLGTAEMARLAPRTPVAPVRVVQPSRNGFKSPPANEPSMADRARTMRDGRQVGTAEGERPPVAPRQGRTERPAPAQGNFSTAPAPANERPQPQPEAQSRGLPQQRLEPPAAPQPRNGERNEFRRNEPTQRFDRPGQARPQVVEPRPQTNRSVERPVMRAPEPAPAVRPAPSPPPQREAPQVRQAPPPMPAREAPRPPPAPATRPAPERRDATPRQPPAKSQER